jgi:hypothetical protein
MSADGQRPHPFGGARLPRRSRRVERQQRMIRGRRAIPEAERRLRRRRLAAQPRRRRRLPDCDRDETGGNDSGESHFALLSTSTTALNAGFG